MLVSAEVGSEGEAEEEEKEEDDEMDARGGGDCTADCCCEAARPPLPAPAPAPVPPPPLGAAAADTIGRDAGRRASAATSGWISAARAVLTCSTPASAAELERLPISFATRDNERRERRRVEEVSLSPVHRQSVSFAHLKSQRSSHPLVPLVPLVLAAWTLFPASPRRCRTRSLASSCPPPAR